MSQAWPIRYKGLTPAWQLLTQLRPFPVFLTVPDSGQAACTGFLPKAEIQEATPLRKLSRSFICEADWSKGAL